MTAFHIRGGGTPTDGPVTYRGEAHCVRVDADGMSGSPVALELEWARSLTSIRFEETGLTLSRPRVLDTSGGVKRMVYDVSAQTSSALDGRVALCERS